MSAIQWPPNYKLSIKDFEAAAKFPVHLQQEGGSNDGSAWNQQVDKFKDEHNMQIQWSYFASTVQKMIQNVARQGRLIPDRNPLMQVQVFTSTDWKDKVWLDKVHRTAADTCMFILEECKKDLDQTSDNYAAIWRIRDDFCIGKVEGDVGICEGGAAVTQFENKTIWWAVVETEKAKVEVDFGRLNQDMFKAVVTEPAKYQVAGFGIGKSWSFSDLPTTGHDLPKTRKRKRELDVRCFWR